MTSPAVGVLIASRCVVVMRGGRNPRVVLSTWSCALAVGFAAPTFTRPELSMIRRVLVAPVMNSSDDPATFQFVPIAQVYTALLSAHRMEALGGVLSVRWRTIPDAALPMCPMFNRPMDDAPPMLTRPFVSSHLRFAELPRNPLLLNWTSPAAPAAASESFVSFIISP